MNEVIMGLDVGGTKIEVAILSREKPHVFMFRKRAPTPSHSYENSLQVMLALVREAREFCNAQDLILQPQIGFGIPGCLDHKTQKVRGANSLVLNGKPLAQDLRELLGCEVHLQNDANCLGLSECTDGACSDFKMVFAVIIGTGCGGGLIIEQRIWEGAHQIAAEWGHTPLPWMTAQEFSQAPTCWCTKHACMETWVSGPALSQDTPGHAPAPTIIEQMRLGSAPETLAFERYASRLGRGLAQIVNILDPDAFVLGGGMSNVDELYPMLALEMKKHTFQTSVSTPLFKAQHGDSSGVRGAAFLCL